MLCNAGRNYLVIRSDGNIYRCQCHLETPLGDMKDVEAWLPNDIAECAITERCERSHWPEWQRATRFSSPEVPLSRGELAGDPHGELVTRITLTGEQERTADEWCGLLKSFARHYKKCWHRIEGHDPADFTGIAKIIEQIAFLGDYAYYVSDLTSRSTRLVDVLSKAKVDCIQFTAIIDPSAPGFDELRMLGRLRLIQERGFKLQAYIPGKIPNIHLFEQFRDKITNKYGIPLSLVPDSGDYPSCMQATATEESFAGI